MADRLVVGRQTLDLLAEVRILVRQPFLKGSHRLVVKDTGLSRQRHGFESRWDYQKASVAQW